MYLHEITGCILWLHTNHTRAVRINAGLLSAEFLSHVHQLYKIFPVVLTFILISNFQKPILL